MASTGKTPKFTSVLATGGASLKGSSPGNDSLGYYTGWTDFSGSIAVTPSAGSITSPTYFSAYQVVGDLVFVQYGLLFTNASGATYTVTLPLTASNSPRQYQYLACNVMNANVNVSGSMTLDSAVSTTLVSFYSSLNGSSGFTANAGTHNEVYIQFFYHKA